jgi:magnesium chelatase subunit D
VTQGPSARSHLPFSSVVGQEDAKLALLLAAIEPRLGGVLLRGDKGSAKTTLARGLAALLPEGAPFVELPLGAGEDRVVGAIDVAALLDTRTHAFRPGLLAAAHGGVLYVDEVNLLPDHLVDTLLDVAAFGVNRVERDGFSEAHPARFVLVGSMNPEEGELRPQLLDRFGLAVDVRASDDPEVRAEIVRRQLAFEADVAPDPAPASNPSADDELRMVLEGAGAARCDDETVRAAARLAVAVGAQGLRADLALCRAACALAGFEGRDRPVPDDLRRVAPLVLGHRRRRDPFEAPGIASDELSSALDDALDDGAPDEGGSDGGGLGDGGRAEEPDGSSDGGPEGCNGPDGPPGDQPDRPEGSGGTEAAGERPPAPAAADRPDVRVEAPVPARQVGRISGRRGPSRGQAASSPGRAGRQIGHEALGGAGRRLDPTATAVANTTRTGGAGGELRAEDLRAVVAAEPRATLVILAVDASGSMAGRRRLDAARAAVLALLSDAYRRRDRVAMIVFRGESAELVLRPTGSVEIARARLADLPSGGRTPLAAGLVEVTKLVQATQRAGGPGPAVVVITDGRATAGGPDPLAEANAAAAELAATGVASLVIDAETGPIKLGLAGSLAAQLNADHVLLENLVRDDLGRGGEGEGVAEAIRRRIAPPATIP